MDTFSFEGVFSKAGNFFSKNTVAVLLTGLLFFAVFFAAELFIGATALKYLERIQSESISSAYDNFGQDADIGTAGIPADFSARNPFGGRFSNLMKLTAALRFLPMLVSGILSFCLISLFLPACRGEKLKLVNVIPPGFPFLRYLGFVALFSGSIIISAAILIKLVISLLFVIPSSLIFAMPLSMLVLFVFFVLAAVRLCFTPVGFLDNVRFIDSMKQSFILTKGNMLKIFAMILCLWIINFFGGLIIIGRIFTFPFSTLVIIYAYLELTAMPETDEETDVPAVPSAALEAEEIKNDFIK